MEHASYIGKFNGSYEDTSQIGLVVRKARERTTHDESFGFGIKIIACENIKKREIL